MKALACVPAVVANDRCVSYAEHEVLRDWKRSLAKVASLPKEVTLSCFDILHSFPYDDCLWEGASLRSLTMQGLCSSVDLKGLTIAKAEGLLLYWPFVVACFLLTRTEVTMGFLIHFNYLRGIEQWVLWVYKILDRVTAESGHTECVIFLIFEDLLRPCVIPLESLCQWLSYV